MHFHAAATAAATSHAEPSTPVGVASPPSVAVATTPRLNQTCAALFESPAPGIVDGSKVSISETPARPDLLQARRGNVQAQEVSGKEEAEKKDYHRGESVETIPGDVIILDDVTNNNNPAHSSSNSTVESASSEQSAPGDKELQTSLPPAPPGPIHMVYSHAHAYDSHIRPFEDESPKRPHTGRPLSLRDGGSNKVKWKEVNIPASTSASSGNLSETKLPTSPDKMTPPHHHDDDGSETASSSSSPEQTSPSLLRASNSPWKVTRSNSSNTSLQQQQQLSTPSTSVDMTHSLFARTPAAVDHVASSVVTMTPVSTLKSHIPQSDSQFSLDVSQSIPLSPELCPMTNQSHKPPTHGGAVKKQTTDDPETNPSPPDPLSNGKKTPHGVDCSVLPITPGVPSVNKILSRQKGWPPVPGLSPVSERAPVTSDDSLRNVSGKRRQDQVDSEDEDILPQSKVHKLTSECDTVETCMCEDETRLDQEHMDSSEDREYSDSAMSPVMLYHTSTTSTSAARSSNAMSSSVTDEPKGTVKESSCAPQPHAHKQE